MGRRSAEWLIVAGNAWFSNGSAVKQSKFRDGWTGGRFDYTKSHTLCRSSWATDQTVSADGGFAETGIEDDSFG